MAGAPSVVAEEDGGGPGEGEGERAGARFGVAIAGPASAPWGRTGAGPEGPGATPAWLGGAEGGPGRTFARRRRPPEPRGAALLSPEAGPGSEGGPRAGEPASPRGRTPPRRGEPPVVERKLRQLFLDFGQEQMRTCTTCGMVFCVGVKEDEELHAAQHERWVSGVRFRGWAKEHVVWRAGPGPAGDASGGGGERVLLVRRQGSPPGHMRKVGEVGDMVCELEGVKDPGEGRRGEEKSRPDILTRFSR